MYDVRKQAEVEFDPAMFSPESKARTLAHVEREAEEPEDEEPEDQESEDEESERGGESEQDAGSKEFAQDKNSRGA